MGFPYSFPSAFPGEELAFTANFTAAESNDGKKVTFTNTSNFDDDLNKRELFTVNRLVIKDAYGAIIDTLNFPITGPSKDIIVYPLATDSWLEVTLELFSYEAYEKTSKFSFYKMFMQKYKSALRIGGKKQTLNKDFTIAGFFKDVAEYCIPIADATEFQENIDSANAYLNQCK